jgi:hypothetical protein
MMIEKFSSIESTQESLNLVHVSADLRHEAIGALWKDGIIFQSLDIYRFDLENFKKSISPSSDTPTQARILQQSAAWGV